MAVERAASKAPRPYGPVAESREDLLRNAVPPDPPFAEWRIEGLTEEEELAFLAAIDAT